MKKRDLILGLGILSAFSMSAASPYQGSVPPAEGSQDFYLYQVETGKWLQNNQRKDGDWTTRGQLDKNGFDVAVSVVDGGYRLDPKLGHNHSINGHNWYLDTGDALTVWTFEPVEVDGVTNAYNIVAVAGPGEGYPRVLGADANGDLTTSEEDAFDVTWQLVTREERIAKMVDGTNTDAAWLIPGQDFGRQDDRLGLWARKFVSNGSGIGHDGVMFNAVREAWNNATDYMEYITLTDLPNGTYKFSFRGYYRDGDQESAEVQQRVIDGTEIRRASYFAGGNEALVAKYGSVLYVERPNGEAWQEVKDADENVVGYVPNSMQCAGRTFVEEDAGLNEWIDAVVTDGTLTVGVIKREGAERDWLIYDDFQLQYVSDATPAGNYNTLIENLNGILAEFDGLPQTPGAAQVVADAREALASNNGNAMRVAYLKLVTLVSGLKGATSEITLFNTILPLAQAEGADVTRPLDEFNKAADRGAFQEALKQLRWARRRAHAERSELPYTGSAAEPGDYYLYNVGQKQFLVPGSDWGAHAALGFPGLKISLEAAYDGENDGTFHIDTHCYNGDTKHYLNYRGYVDCDKAGAWRFIPVAGKENVYRIEQNDYEGVVMAYNIDANTDGDDNRDETTVGCENRNYQGPAEDAEWMLITPEERAALLETATLDNPVDASFFIQNPNFCQREDISEWSFTGDGDTGTYQRGERRPDFCIQSWNSTECDMSILVEGLPAGIYRFSANAFFRNGDHQTSKYADDDENHPGEVHYYGALDTEPNDVAFLYAGGPENDVLLPNIVDGAGVAIAEGGNAVAEDGTVYNYPQVINQAPWFFRLGAYKVHTYFELTPGEDAQLGIFKESRTYEHDWIVADNFRLLYYGNDTTLEDAKSGIEEVTAVPAVEVKDTRIFNLQGIQVTNTNTPGIYIQNGKKFVVR